MEGVPSMNRLMMLLVVLLVLTVPLIAQEKMAKAEKEVTVKGEVVDVSCYLHMGAKGDGHKDCAVACAKNGAPLGILTKDGTVYVSIVADEHKTNPNTMLMDHIAHQVEVKGYKNSKGGVNGIRITSVAMAK